MKSKLTRTQVSFMAIALIVTFSIGCFVGSIYERQTLFQSYGFQVQNYTNALKAINAGETPAAVQSLEISLAAGVLLMPKEGSLTTALSKSYINTALGEAKCYGDKSGWKNLSPETAELVKAALKEVGC